MAISQPFDDASLELMVCKPLLLLEPATCTSQRGKDNMVVEKVYLCHRTPDLCALDVGNVACPGQVQPVGLVQLGPNEEVEISDSVILSHQGSSQSKLGVCLDNANDLHR